MPLQLPPYRYSLRDLRDSESLAERSAKRSADESQRRAERDAIVAEAQARIAAADQSFEAASSAAQAAATKEDESHWYRAQRAAHAELKPLLAQFLTTFAPKDAIAVAAKVRELHAEHARVVGERHGRGGGVSATLGSTLYLVLAGLMIDADPRCAAPFAQRGASLSSWFSAAPLDALSAANAACIASPPDPVTLVTSLQNLQRSVAAVAASATTSGPSDAKRFEANCFGGSPEAIEAAHAAIDAEEEAERIAAYNAERELGDAARRGEQVEGRDNAWHLAQRAVRWAIAR